jgi:peptidoglycan/LPS O-acetylase OafA/YrhL
MYLRSFPLFIVVLIGIPVVFATLLLFAPFMAFDQQADADIYILYIGTLWLLCAPALIMETYRRSIRNELSGRFIVWMFALAGIALPALALVLAPTVTLFRPIYYFYIIFSGLCAGIGGALVLNWVFRRNA